MSDATLVWPDGCRKPNTCERHRMCAYGPCRWQSVDISGAIDNAIAMLAAAQNAPARPDDATERARLEGEVARLREALEKIITYEEDICLSEMLHTSERMNACVRIARKALRHDPR